MTPTADYSALIRAAAIHLLDAALNRDGYRPGRPQRGPFDGRAVQHGLLRPEWGPNVYDVQCDRCNATWVGWVGEPCSWCEESYELLLKYQREALLTPPDVDPDDRNVKPRFEAWADRMKRGVEVGLITRDEGLRAWRRIVGGDRNADRAA